MRNSLVGLVVVLGGLSGCGDNTRACGPGTVEEGGYCVPAATCGFGTREDEETGECVPDGSVVCAGGTVFDPLTGQCEIDEAACQDGTVLIGDACVDPTAGLVINVQEGPEPNGLGVIELSEAQAGNIVVPAAGAAPFVLRGTLDPHRDLDGNTLLDPDVDTFVLTVGGPTFLRVTADGVNGAAAGFIAVATGGDAGDVLAGWERIGLSLITDTSQRELFLPAAGTYHLAIADTRTLLEYASGGTVIAAPGGDTSHYYVSITQTEAPTPIELPLTNGTASTTRTKSSEQLAVFRAPLGSGMNRIELAMPSALAEAAVTVVSGTSVRAVALEDDTGIATAFIGGLDPAEPSLIVVDQRYALVPTPLSYTLDVQAANATALSTTGGNASATATANVGGDFLRLNLWSFDVSADDTTLGVHLDWSLPVIGQLYDETGVEVASFTEPVGGATWTSYRGLVRVRRAGRYYFAVYAPSATSQTTINVTSTITEIAPAPIAFLTPLAASPITSFGVTPYTHTRTQAVGWQQFDVTGIATGGQEVSWFDLAATYGRLDALATAGGTLGPEVAPLFARTYPAGGGAFGRVVLSDPTDYFVKVNATSPSTNPTVTLTFTPRALVTYLGDVDTGMSVGRTLQQIDSATPQRYYLFRTPPGRVATITVTPTSNVNTQFRRLAADESPLGALINANGADVETFMQGAAGWTAFVVSAAGPLSQPRTFDVLVQVQ